MHLAGFWLLTKRHINQVVFTASILSSKQENKNIQQDRILRVRTTYDNYIDVTDEFKRVQIKPFEKYMDSVLGETSSEITDFSDYIS